MRHASMRTVWTGLVALALPASAVLAVDDRTPPAPDPRLPAKVELGRRLFFEPAVSRGGRVSCASCHDPSHGFTDKAHPSVDEWGFARRRTMPLADLPEGPFHSDGEFPTVRNLLDARIAPLDLLREIDLERLRAEISGVSGSVPRGYGTTAGDPPGLVRVADRLAGTGFYARAFTEAFGDAAPSHDRVCAAVETYLATVRTAPNALDRFLAGDDAALTPAAALGFGLFTGKAGCAQCHEVRPVDGRAPLRDGKFHDTGISHRTAESLASRSSRDGPDEGLGGITTDAAARRRDRMKFKTPSLRDVARRGPFMHDGSLATLADVVEHYDAGGSRHAGLDPAIRKLALTEDEKDRLLAFLFSLSGDERAGLSDAPRAPRTTRVRIVDPSGAPRSRTRVEIEPAGDAFRTAAPVAADVAAAPAGVVTDAEGWIRFEFPPTTHVRFRIEGAAVADLLPDCADESTLVAVPADRVALRIRSGPDAHPKGVRAVHAPKVDGDGRVLEKPDDDVVEFRFVRALSEREGLYLAPAPARGAPASRRLLLPDGKGGSALNSVIDVDLRGGATSAADLTPKRDAADVPR